MRLQVGPHLGTIFPRCPAPLAHLYEFFIDLATRALRGSECNREWVLKKVPQQNAFSSASMPSAVLLSPFDYVAAGRTGGVGRLRTRTSRLMV